MNRRKAFAVFALSILIFASVCGIGAGYSFVADTYNSGNTALPQYVVLSSTNYNLTDQENGYDGYNTIVQRMTITTEITSAEGADNTVMTITIPDRSVLSGGDKFELWIKSKDSGTPHHAVFRIQVSNTTDQVESFTATDGQEKSSYDTIHVKISNGGSYSFTVTVTGMKSHSNATATFSRTVYQIEGDIVALSGGFSGRLIGSDTLKSERHPSNTTTKVTLSCAGFKSFSNWR